MDQIKFAAPTPDEYRAIRYGIHRNVHGLEIAEANRLADADLTKWLADHQAARAADDLQVAA